MRHTTAFRPAFFLLMLLATLALMLLTMPRLAHGG
jgi:hypothetical protein